MQANDWVDAYLRERAANEPGAGRDLINGFTSSGACALGRLDVAPPRLCLSERGAVSQRSRLDVFATRYAAMHGR